MGMKEYLARRRAERLFAEETIEIREDQDIITPDHSVFRQEQPKRPDKRSDVPHSIEAEKGVLGSILCAAQTSTDKARKVMFDVESKIGGAHFFQPNHKSIFATIRTMHEDNDPLDLITLTSQLEAQGATANVGGPSYLAGLMDYVSTSANIDYYIAILQEKFRLRQILELADKIRDEAKNSGTKSTEILDSTQDTLKAIIGSARIGELPDLDDMSQLIGENLPTPPPELVMGLLHQGSKLIIGGVSKGRKTWSLMDLGISVATGTPWWGSETQKGKVCYINFEIQRPFFASRFAQICRAKNIVPAPGMFKCWTLRGLVDGIEKLSANIIKVLMQDDYSLIIFDPIYKALGDRDENKAGDVASMLNELEAIAVKTGAAIAFGAHYSKGNQAGKDSIDRIGGSGVFARDPDAILTMTTHEQEECFTVDTTLRNFPPQEPFVVRWEWPVFERDTAQDPNNIKQAAKGGSQKGASGQFTRKYSIDDILEALKEAGTPRTPTELKNIVSSECGMGSSKFWMLWDEAKASPYVIKVGKRYQHISSVSTK